MSSNVEVPALGESITEAVLVRWHKNEGDRVAVDEPLCELESDKATVDLPAPVGGVLHPLKQAGETAHVGEVIAQIDEAAAPAAAESPTRPKLSEREPQKPTPPKSNPQEPRTPEAKPLEPKPPEPKPSLKPEIAPNPIAEREVQPVAPQFTPAAPNSSADNGGIRRVAMSKIRRSIAERMVRAQQSMAMLTTFNEIDMTAVQELRKRHQERFKAAHGFSLGLVSLFAWASARALKQYPVLNAQLDGPDIVYHDHVHLGVAVSTERGLVVPVLRNVESMSLPRIEAEIKRVASAAREGKLSIQELSGGTFTITNGGIFGSLLSTPILNPPQTGILGLHVIQDRPVAIQRQVQIRPMMYVALTYDHRLADGQDAVLFLVRLKQVLEDPIQMLLEI
jgi:2-oxoglutarate dehydrogenase E2 component (dihydrolipoamide succinyltransferase)